MSGQDDTSQDYHTSTKTAKLIDDGGGGKLVKAVSSKDRLIDQQNSFYDKVGRKYCKANFTSLTEVLKNQASTTVLSSLPREVSKAIKVLTKPLMKKNNGKIKYINKYLRRVNYEIK